MNEPHRPVYSVAGAYLDSLASRGIRYVFANSGTDFAPIIEAMVAASEERRTIPRFITVPHENVAVAMAHGYYRVCGRPAAVMVHVTVGTANALCGIMNAARDNVPLLLAAGHTPHTEEGHIGSRNAWIHWGQDSFDQGGILREYVKWDYELRAGQPADVIVGRALDIAMSEPRGPVYLTLPREVLGNMAAALPPPPIRPMGARPATPDEKAIEDVARALTDAEFPLILTSSGGRDPAGFNRLAELADEFAIAVGQPNARDINLPSDHPMNFGMHPDAAIERADAIVLIDCEVPWTSPAGAPKPGTRLIHIAADPFFARYPLRGFRADLAVAGSTTPALRMLHDALRSFAPEETRNIDARREAITRMTRALMEQRRDLIREGAGLRPIHPAWLAACVNAVKRPDTFIINELGVPMDLLDLREPRTYMTSSLAAGLGQGLGASLGARLAEPDLDVIAVVGDGSYMFGNPTPAHFVARAEGLPTLTVVANNRRWDAVHRSTVSVYPHGLAARTDPMPLVELAPSPDFEKIIEACGGHGERVEDPGELVAALTRAREAVAAGTPALLNVITRP